MTDFSVEMRGIQEAQAASLQLIMAMRPGGVVEKGVKYGTLQAHRHAVPSTPHEHGVLRAAHRAKYEGGLQGRVFIDPGAPGRKGTPPAKYGAILHGHGMIPGVRSGVRAFYEYTVETYGTTIASGAIKIIEAGLP